MNAPAELERAALNAREARDRLIATACEIRARVAPARLIGDAVETARTGAADVAEQAVAVARRRPALVAGGAALVVALLAGRPIVRLGRRWRRGKGTE